MPPVRRRRAGPQQRQVAANYANQPSIQDASRSRQLRNEQNKQMGKTFMETSGKE